MQLFLYLVFSLSLVPNLNPDPCPIFFCPQQLFKQSPGLLGPVLCICFHTVARAVFYFLGQIY